MRSVVCLNRESISGEFSHKSMQTMLKLGETKMQLKICYSCVIHVWWSALSFRQLSNFTRCRAILNKSQTVVENTIYGPEINRLFNAFQVIQLDTSLSSQSHAWINNKLQATMKFWLRNRRKNLICAEHMLESVPEEKTSKQHWNKKCKKREKNSDFF